MESPRCTDPLIETPFVILPGEVRQVRVHLDPRREFEGSLRFNGWITSDPAFTVVEARAGSMKVNTREVPPDVDPREAEWACTHHLLPPGEDLVLLVKNVGDRPAPYRAHLR